MIPWNHADLERLTFTAHSHTLPTKTCPNTCPRPRARCAGTLPLYSGHMVGMDENQNLEPTTWMTRKEAAALLRKSPQTLANWNSMGIGPKAVRPGGGQTLYRRGDVEAWVAHSKRSAA